MKIRKRVITVLLVILLLFALLNAFGYVNSLVSYKYEVEDFQIAGQDQYYGLNQHQIQILKAIHTCKALSILFTFLSVITLFIRLAKPTFNGRVVYS